MALFSGMSPDDFIGCKMVRALTSANRKQGWPASHRTLYITHLHFNFPRSTVILLMFELEVLFLSILYVSMQTTVLQIQSDAAVPLLVTYAVITFTMVSDESWT
jgi:hypothetical protein